jgi:hypothetical protein
MFVASVSPLSDSLFNCLMTYQFKYNPQQLAVKVGTVRTTEVAFSYHGAKCQNMF